MVRKELLPTVKSVWLECACVFVLLLLLAHHAVRLRAATKSQALVSLGEDVDDQDAFSSCGFDRRITFLVAAWNAAGDLSAFMEAYHSISIPDKELILCVGGTDGSFAKALTFAGDGVVVREQHAGMGKQKALETIFPLASGDAVYLTDIDSRLADESVLPMVAALRRSESGCVTGSMRPLDQQRTLPFVAAQWGIERFSSLRSPKFVTGLLGANTLVDRSAIVESGSFRQTAPSGTDYTLAKELQRCGRRIEHVVKSEVKTDFPVSMRAYWRRRARWLRNVARIGPAYGCRQEAASVWKTIGIAVVYVMLLALGLMFWIAWMILLLALVHSLLNRLRYCLSAQVGAPIVGILQTILGDIIGSLVAGWDMIGGKYTW